MTVRTLVVSRARDVREALTTAPHARAWRQCALVYLAFLVFAAPIGLLSGLIKVDLPHEGAAGVIGGSVMLFAQPAFFEEFVFRGLLLPRDPGSMRRSRLVLFGGAALALYVAAHPVNAFLFRPSVLGVFGSFAYLTVTAMLGVACTTAYWLSRSLWPSVVMHWLTVVAWLWFLGGRALLY